VNVDRMLSEVDVRHLDEWRAYANLEPFDETRADARAAQVVQALHNVIQKRKKPMALEDAMLKYVEVPEAKPVKSQTKDELFAIDQKNRAYMSLLTAAMKQKPKRKERR
jgi:hypothetical protein